MRKFKLIVIVLIIGICTIVVCACKPSPEIKNYMISYISQDGGIVYGDLNQTVIEGEDGTQVVAVANEGFKFVGWSDGETEASRTEEDVSEDLILYAKFERIVTYTVSYISQDGGVVYGDLNQTVIEGEDGTQVVAVANEGFKFVGWSDGKTEFARTEIEVSEDLTLTAGFEKLITHMLIYSESEGNYIIGEDIQTVQNGESGSTVIAKSKNGYRFIKWSDGVKDRRRIDVNIKQDIDVTAISEKIVIEFYSDSYLVRKLNAVDINSTDLDSLIGYKSNSKFLGWKLKGDITDGVFTDARYILKQQYDMFGITDVDNIQLIAVYEPEDKGNTPSNFITIAHALGGYNGKAYTNSREAFDCSYSHGARFFEVDLAFTTDWKVVASHSNVSVTFDEFINSSSGVVDFTPLTLEDIITYMLTDVELYFDLDTLRWDRTEQFEKFATALERAVGDNREVLDRIIVEITPFNLDLITILKEQLNMENFLYTECWNTNDLEIFEAKCLECAENGVKFCSIASDPQWAISSEKVRLCHKYGIYTMAYTVNDTQKMYELYDLGVDCIFTDFGLM